MGRRHFAELSVREPGSPHPVPRYRLTCGSCGAGETLGRQSFGPAIADEQVPKKFEAKGWSVGQRANGQDDRCPACVNREQELKRKRLHIVENAECVLVSKPDNKSERIEDAFQRHGLSAVAPSSKAVPAAEKPREPSRDERRLIWAKLEEIYIDEKSGYSAGWTDARVATDLGVPRAWVSTIREENFGPGTSEEVTATLTEARAVAVEAAEFRRSMDALTSRGAEILKRADALDRAAKRIEAAIR